MVPQSAMRVWRVKHLGLVEVVQEIGWVSREKKRKAWPHGSSASCNNGYSSFSSRWWKAVYSVWFFCQLCKYCFWGTHSVCSFLWWLFEFLVCCDAWSCGTRAMPVVVPEGTRVKMRVFNLCWIYKPLKSVWLHEEFGFFFFLGKKNHCLWAWYDESWLLECVLGRETRVQVCVGWVVWGLSKFFHNGLPFQPPNLGTGITWWIWKVGRYRKVRIITCLISVSQGHREEERQ